MKERSELIPVYFMPGMATGPSIFSNIKLPEDRFTVHYLDWKIPHKNEDLISYSKRISKAIKHENPVLIGVSFGGVIVQEIARFLKIRRLIIVSSIKCSDEMPSRMKIAGRTGLFRLIPTSLAEYVDHFEKVALGEFLKTRARLYKEYIAITDKRYLDWAIKNMVKWNCDKPNEEVIHIHGDNDEVFPIRNIKDAFIVKGGTHIMIINRFRWFNEHLPELILAGDLRKKEERK